MAKFLDDNGLLYLWSKIKAYVDTHSSSSFQSEVIRLETSKWITSDLYLYQNVEIEGLTSDSNVFVSAIPEDIDAYAYCDVRAISQSEGILEFRSNFIPSRDFIVNVIFS